MMWKILTAQIWEEIYNLLVCHGLYFEEQKGCHKGIEGTGDLMYIDLHLVKESKTKRKNVAIVWIVNKKPYDMVPQF